MTPKKTLNIAGNILELDETKVMGVVNVTPDSFYAGSRTADPKDALEQVANMLAEGATFIDVGGYSSRPGADDISEAEELQRTIPVIEALNKEFPQALISIDTFRSTVARAAVHSGASLINDISGGHLDQNMLSTVAELKVPYIGMHMKGTPQTMKSLTAYDDLLMEMMRYFGSLKEACLERGIHDLILDPGFGFAKTIEQNYYLLNHYPVFKQIGCPVLVGISRKSMIYKTLRVEPADALNGTTVLNTIALMKGVDILRVHDVKEAVEAVSLVKKFDDSRV